MQEKKSFKEIISMIVSACNAEFYSGPKEVKDTIIECATKIYIEQMKEGAENGNTEENH